MHERVISRTTGGGEIDLLKENGLLNAQVAQQKKRIEELKNDLEQIPILRSALKCAKDQNLVERVVDVMEKLQRMQAALSTYVSRLDLVLGGSGFAAPEQVEAKFEAWKRTDTEADKEHAEVVGPHIVRKVALELARANRERVNKLMAEEVARDAASFTEEEDV